MFSATQRPKPWTQSGRNGKKSSAPRKKARGTNAPSALDGIPKHLPALLRAEKLVKKARKAGLLVRQKAPSRSPAGRTDWAGIVPSWRNYAQERGWSAEDLLRSEIQEERARLAKTGAANAEKIQT